MAARTYLVEDDDLRELLELRDRLLEQQAALNQTAQELAIRATGLEARLRDASPRQQASKLAVKLDAAAALLDISEPTLRLHIRNGELGQVRLGDGAAVRIPMSELERFVRAKLEGAA